MKSIIVSGTQLKCSKFVFGTANLLRVGSYRSRINLLKAAIDHGFTHFDTSPYYGFGIAEKDLSCFSSVKEVTIATKVGIYPKGGGNQADALVRLRKVAGKIVKSFSRPIVDFSVKTAADSLEASLRRLRRESIDLLLLHEPYFDLVNTDEWRDWISKSVNLGKIRFFGISTTKDRALPFLKSGSPLLHVCQLQDDFDNPVSNLLAQFGRTPQITFGYVSSAMKVSSMPINQVLARSLMANPEGAIIVSTTKIDRLVQYQKALEA